MNTKLITYTPIIILLIVVTASFAVQITTFSGGFSSVVYDFSWIGGMNNSTSFEIPNSVSVMSAVLNLTGDKKEFVLEAKLSNATDEYFGVYANTNYICAVSSGTGGNISIWNKSGLVFDQLLTEPNSPVYAIFIDDDHIYGGDFGSYYNGSVYVWNSTDFSFKYLLTPHNQTPTTSTGIRDIYTDSDNIYASSEDSNIYIWNRTDLSFVNVSDGTDKMFGVHADDKFIYGANKDNNVYIWNKTDFSLNTTLSGAGIETMDVFVDSNYIFASGLSGDIKIWNKTTRVLNTTLTDASILIWRVYADDTFIYGASHDKKVYIWNYDDFSLNATLSDANTYLKGIYADSDYIYSVGSDNYLYIWNQNLTYPINVMLFVGNSTIAIFNNTGEGDFDTENISTDFSSQINSLIPDCTCSPGCSLSDSVCTVYLNISSDEAGIITMNSFDLMYATNITYIPSTIIQSLENGSTTLLNISLNSSDIDALYDYNLTWNSDTNYGGNFTISFSPNPVGVNVTWNDSVMNITVSSSADVGVYYGNVTITFENTTKEGWNISTELTVGILSGNLYSITLDQWTDTITSAQSISKVYILNNTGNYVLTNCNFSITSDGGYPSLNSFATYNETNFNISVGEPVAVEVTLNNPGSGQYYFNQPDPICIATASGGLDTLDTKPYISITVSEGTGSSNPSSPGVVYEFSNVTQIIGGELCGNGVCDSADGENFLNCPEDCSIEESPTLLLLLVLVLIGVFIYYLYQEENMKRSSHRGRYL
jgi:hypothetical protein